MSYTTIQQLFLNGMDRSIPDLITPPEGPQINLGPGDKKKIEYFSDDPDEFRVAVGVGPKDNALTEIEWSAGYPLPFDDHSLAAVHAYHVMEHIPPETVALTLSEVSRVLKPGGSLFQVTPYPGHGLFYQDPGHVTQWTEESWHTLIDNYYYPAGKGVDLEVHVCFLMGLVERNLCLFSQLIKNG